MKKNMIIGFALALSMYLGTVLAEPIRGLVSSVRGFVTSEYTVVPPKETNVFTGIVLASTGASKDGRKNPTTDKNLDRWDDNSRVTAVWGHKTRMPIGFWTNLRIEKTPIGEIGLVADLVPSEQFKSTPEYQFFLKRYNDRTLGDLSVSVEVNGNDARNDWWLTGAALVCSGNLTNGLFDQFPHGKVPKHTKHIN